VAAEIKRETARRVCRRSCGGLQVRGLDRFRDGFPASPSFHGKYASTISWKSASGRSTQAGRTRDSWGILISGPLPGPRECNQYLTRPVTRVKMSPGRVRRILAGVRGEPRIPSLGEIARILFGKDHKGGCFAVIVPVLKSYLDESSDGGNKEVFCVGAILANEVQFPPMENAWLERLRVPDDIPYFHASACNGVHEPFFKLRSKYGADAQALVDQLRTDLESILLLHPWVGFGLGVLIPDYREVWGKNSDAKKLYEEDPTQAAYQQMFFEITKSAQSYSKDCQISFIATTPRTQEKLLTHLKPQKLIIQISLPL